METEALTDRRVDAQSVLPPDWIAMCDAVQHEPDDAARIEYLEEFLEPRWQACRPQQPLQVQRYADWAVHLAQRAALSAPGRSLRQLERRIKRWAGLPLRELRGFGKAEQAFFDTIAAEATAGSVNWADVAAGAGYADQSHLSRVTRRITGYAPQALYRAEDVPDLARAIAHQLAARQQADTTVDDWATLIRRVEPMLMALAASSW